MEVVREVREVEVSEVGGRTTCLVRRGAAPHSADGAACRLVMTPADPKAVCVLPLPACPT